MKKFALKWSRRFDPDNHTTRTFSRKTEYSSRDITREISVPPWFTLQEQHLFSACILCIYFVDIKFFLPNVLDVKKRGRAFLKRGDGLFGISGRSSQCGVREEPTERRQSAGQARAFLQLRHFKGQSATGRLPLCHEAVVLLREIKIPIMAACQSPLHPRHFSLVNYRNPSQAALIGNRQDCKRRAKNRHV